MASVSSSKMLERVLTAVFTSFAPPHMSKLSTTNPIATSDFSDKRRVSGAVGSYDGRATVSSSLKTRV